MINSDYHVHTLLSPCASRFDGTVENYIVKAKEQGLTKIGFSDHTWDSAVPGAHKWYIPLSVEHTMEVKKDFPSDCDIKLLVGAELEMDKYNVVGMTAEKSHLFDFLLIATSHMHFKGFTIDSDVQDAALIRKKLLQRVEKAISIDFISGLAHPFHIMGFDGREDEILRGFTDHEFMDIFSEVSDAKKSVEINKDIFNASRYSQNEDGFPVEFIRVFQIANEAGCSFHLGSDCHKVIDMSGYDQLNAFASFIGIREESFIPLEKLGKR